MSFLWQQQQQQNNCWWIYSYSCMTENSMKDMWNCIFNTENKHTNLAKDKRLQISPQDHQSTQRYTHSDSLTAEVHSGKIEGHTETVLWHRITPHVSSTQEDTHRNQLYVPLSAEHAQCCCLVWQGRACGPGWWPGSQLHASLGHTKVLGYDLPHHR